MNNDFLNIYNNLVKLTRNKNLFLSLKNNDTFSDRLVVLLFHFGFLLKIYKFQISKKYSQDLFDYFVRQIELSIREIGYGDVAVNKKMKDYVNLFYSILEKIEKWDNISKDDKIDLFSKFININEDNDLIVNYFDKYRDFLLKNSLNIFTKDIINLEI